MGVSDGNSILFLSTENLKSKNDILHPDGAVFVQITQQNGRLRRPPQRGVDIANCDFKMSNSSRDSCLKRWVFITDIGRKNNRGRAR